jgi:hypothetical protein
MVTARACRRYEEHHQLGTEAVSEQALLAAGTPQISRPDQVPQRVDGFRKRSAFRALDQRRRAEMGRRERRFDIRAQSRGTPAVVEEARVTLRQRHDRQNEKYTLHGEGTSTEPDGGSSGCTYRANFSPVSST